mmetsp:Transcript_51039/g.153419  ORF Transcript_51039/g.153419 Transcript_51039/m.153419 type:complete len:96 (-) Transcript_51039:1008-1295(-)
MKEDPTKDLWEEVLRGGKVNRHALPISMLIAFDGGPNEMQICEALSLHQVLSAGSFEKPSASAKKSQENNLGKENGGLHAQGKESRRGSSPEGGI